MDRFHDQLMAEVRTMNQIMRAIVSELRRMNDLEEGKKKDNGEEEEEEDKANGDDNKYK